MFDGWSPNGIIIEHHNNIPLRIIKNDDIKSFERYACMIGNNSGLSRVINERIIKKFDLMYNQRAYIHWYIREHMDEIIFNEARDELANLEKDYLNVTRIQDTSDDDTDY